MIECMEHNACAALLSLAAGALTLHYDSVKEVLNNFPVPVLYGEPGTGKTTALRCAMAAIGAPDNIYSKVTAASVRASLSRSSIPIGIDDPSSKKDAEEVAVQLYNGEAVHTVTHGMQIPRTGIIMTTNFPLDSSARSATRCLLIPFVKPSLKTKVASHYRLNKSLSTVSGGIVYLIQLGNEFKANGMREMDEDIIPQLEKIFPANAFHRIIPQYAALKWFCNKLIKDLNVHDFGEKIDNFFSQQITETVRAYQLEQTSTEDREHDTDYIDCFVQSVLQWAEGKPQGEILQCVKFQPKTR